jgi:hypothetical protein
MRSSGLRDTGVLLLGAGIGAGMMFLLDPRGGAYRRSIVRDKFLTFGRTAVDRADKRSRDLMHRMRGQQYELTHRNEQVDDETLRERVLAQLGHVVSHPGSLQVEIREGCVFVNGPVLAGERSQIEERLSKTRGVQRFDISRLEEHNSAENIPGLQGQSRGKRKVGS